MEYMKNGGNTPTNPELWSRAKAAAKAKYDVYPSAYANGYAAKWYKERGGGWKKAEMGGNICYECGGMYNFGGVYTVPFMEQGGMSMDFSKRFGGYLGEDLPEEVESYEDGGGIPERYKNMGFTKVGVKKESTSDGKKWMVLAKKGDQYKAVHGGYDGMKDYTQHGSEDRRERFWDRMGGRDSAKAKDPFSPLYWHKRFGTWEEGGELSMYDDGGDYYSGPHSDMYQEGDYQVDRVSRHRLENLDNSKWNRGLATATTLTDPRGVAQYLPKGSFLKGMIGLASGLSGATLGYEKMFAKDKHDSKLMNTGTGEYGNTQDVLKARYDKANPTPATAPAQQDMNPDPKTRMTKSGGSGMGATLEAGNMYDDFAGAQSGYMGSGSSTTTSQTSTTTPPASQPLPHRGSKGSGMGNMMDMESMYTPNPAASAAPVMPQMPAGFQDYMDRGNLQQKRQGGMMRFQPGGAVPFNQWFAQNAMRQDVMQNSANQAKLMEMWRSETGQTEETANQPAQNTPANSIGTGTPVKGTGPGSGMYNAMLGQQQLEGVLGDVAVGSGLGTVENPGVKMQQTSQTKYQGDEAGFVAGNNAIVGLGYFADWAEKRDQRRNKSYDQLLRETNNTDSMYNAYNPKNAFGNERTNMAVGPNSQLVMGTPMQDFSQVGARYGGTKRYRQGGTYEVSAEEIAAILAAGGEIEFL